MRSMLKNGAPPSPAMLVAIAALIVALSGTAVAATKIGLNNLKGGTKTQLFGAGPLTYVHSTVSVPRSADPVNSPTILNVGVSCPAGTFVVGGGIEVSNDRAELVNDSDPNAQLGWEGSVVNGGTLNHTATTTAVCATSRSATG